MPSVRQHRGQQLPAGQVYRAILDCPIFDQVHFDAHPTTQRHAGVGEPHPVATRRATTLHLFRRYYRGGGKTYAAIEHAARRAGLGGKTIIAQPSTALIEQTHADLTARHPGVTATMITSETNPKQVVAAVINHMRGYNATGEVLCISHSALMRLPYVHRPADWDLILDEAPSATECLHFQDVPLGLVTAFNTEARGLAYS